MTTLATGQRRDVFVESRLHPAIRYDTAPVSDPVAALNARLQDGSLSLEFDPVSGYLPALLRALEVPVESQTLVFSQTSFQAPLINLHNPRAIYFSDTVAVGWVRGGELLEIAAQDPRQGVVFYSLDQKPARAPRVTRNEQCLSCHVSWETLGVPGLMVQSVYPLPDEKSYVNGFLTVQGSPLDRRWGGWWVTGEHGGAQHMGNVPVRPQDQGKSQPANPTQPLPSLQGQFDLTGYPAPYSDVVALLVLAHQTRMMNLITRAAWEARVAEMTPGQEAGSGAREAAVRMRETAARMQETPTRLQETATRVQEAARDLVDYMLFIDEAPLAGPVRGTAGYAEKFAADGPKDRKGRSLRELDLQRRLFRYPCSYMIHAPAFDALPAAASEAIYARLWEVLSGARTEARYQVLSPADRQAVLEILRDTKPGLPDYFRVESGAAVRGSR